MDILTHPLEGLSLIEASAGSGKTTTLVRLYLRALLIEGLTVEKILAVTFTRAATGELSVRIREALTEAGARLEKSAGASGQAQAEQPQDFWAELFVRAGGNAEELVKRVNAALAAFDETAVFTIHGFCQRALADNAFEAGAPFTGAQIEDEEALRAEVAADFWRHRVGGNASPIYVRWFADTFGSPEGLSAALDKVLAVGGKLKIGPTAGTADVRRAAADFEAAALAAKEMWRCEDKRLRDWFLDGDDLRRNVYAPSSTGTLLDEWEDWLNHAPSPSLPRNFERLTREKASKSLKKDRSLPGCDFFERDPCKALEDASDRLREVWWQETFTAAFEFIRREMRERKRRTRETGFDDMLLNLRDALKGSGGRKLARRIAERYPLILVDEFQDTDPVQYEIFTRINRAGNRHGLILIGDPKQAIYRFRGADVFTYMRVRRQCNKAERIYELTKNYRSTPALLTALNALFEGCEKPFEYEEIPYTPVEPGQEIAPLEQKEDEDAPLTVLWEPASQDDGSGKINKDQAAQRAADICANEIARLLRLGASGKAHYEQDGEKHCIQAQDVAVLVNTNRQGAEVRQALRRLGIAAAMVSPDSVFASAEAEELQIVLAAVAEPTDGGLLRRALATSLLGKTAQELAALAADEERWSRLVGAFRDYHKLWQERGFGAMFSRLIVRQGVTERTLARTDGERAMTNLRHLAELAGEQAAQHPGIAPLLAWFAHERENLSRGNENLQLRLESDENLVRISTIHRAKGLQYPIVFLPFLWDGKKPANKATNPAVLAHDQNYRSVLDLGSGKLERHQEDANEEARSEGARRTYVALTRAERACYLIALPAGQIESSAFARLLNAGNPDALESRLRDWVRAANGSVRMRTPITAGARGEVALARPRGEARAFFYPERLGQRFYVASYSLLAAGARGAPAESPDWDETVMPAPAAEQADGIHSFPAGPASGTFLHAVIEALDFDADAARIEETVQTQLAIHGLEAKWAGGLPPWLATVFATPLGAPGCRLRDIGRARRIDELEFYFPLNPIHAPALETSLQPFAPHTPHPPLHFDELKGLMKGYLDLVFESGGRYWIADYKSNRLGADLAAYTPAALDRAMAEHRYDLQYLIYTVALHRYLKTRIADYDYERHFGGVLYLFLRGMAPDAPEPRGVWHTRPAWRDVERLDVLLVGSKP